MKQQFLMLLFVLAGYMVPAQTGLLEETTLFASGSYTLNPAEKAKLDRLIDALQAFSTYAIQVSGHADTVGFDELDYYVFQAAQTGWYNLDIFMKFPPYKLADMRIDLKPGPNTCVKIVFTERDMVFAASANHRRFTINGVPKGEKAYLVALKMEGNRPQMSLQEVVTDDKAYQVEFRPYNLEGLKKALEKINVHPTAP